MTSPKPSFTLSYRGRLAIDSGSYEKGSGYGSVHWHNYFTRTLAHNSITVFDPGESFVFHILRECLRVIHFLHIANYPCCHLGILLH